MIPDGREFVEHLRRNCVCVRLSLANSLILVVIFFFFVCRTRPVNGENGVPHRKGEIYVNCECFFSDEYGLRVKPTLTVNIFRLLFSAFRFSARNLLSFVALARNSESK